MPIPGHHRHLYVCAHIRACVNVPTHMYTCTPHAHTQGLILCILFYLVGQSLLRSLLVCPSTGFFSMDPHSFICHSRIVGGLWRSPITSFTGILLKDVWEADHGETLPCFPYWMVLPWIACVYPTFQLPLSLSELSLTGLMHSLFLIFPQSLLPL